MKILTNRNNIIKYKYELQIILLTRLTNNCGLGQTSQSFGFQAGILGHDFL